jgi:hypothetical protein
VEVYFHLSNVVITHKYAREPRVSGVLLMEGTKKRESSKKKRESLREKKKNKEEGGYTLFFLSLFFSHPLSLFLLSLLF